MAIGIFRREGRRGYNGLVVRRLRRLDGARRTIARALGLLVIVFEVLNALFEVAKILDGGLCRRLVGSQWG